ncbi:MAG: prepilin peptidase, partial [Rhodanobacteraceae bacterium]
FEAWPIALLLFIGLVGLIVGSFLNVVAYRLPIMMELAWRAQCAELDTHPVPVPAHAQSGRFDLAWPPSTCPSCGQRIAALHNVPVLSYLALRGRCAACGYRISPRYPFVEAAAAILGVAVAYAFGPTWTTVAALGFTWSLLALALIDLDHKLLPDSLTLPLLWAGLLLAAFPVHGAPLFVDLFSSVIGAAAGYLSLWLVYHLFKLATGKEGMGHGDFKLFAAAGAWLGATALLPVIIIAALSGVVGGLIMLRAAGKDRSVPFAFGPFLVIAMWIWLVAGDQILVAYLRLTGFR